MEMVGGGGFECAQGAQALPGIAFRESYAIPETGKLECWAGQKAKKKFGAEGHNGRDVLTGREPVWGRRWQSPEMSGKSRGIHSSPGVVKNCRRGRLQGKLWKHPFFDSRAIA